MLKLKIEPGDQVYLKNAFAKYFRKQDDLLYRPTEMNIFQGQRVVITNVITTYCKQKKTHSIVCSYVRDMLDRTHSVRLPLILIDRSMPLIRNGKKISLIKKELYIREL